MNQTGNDNQMFTAYFERSSDAERAQESLIDMGIPKSAISLHTRSTHSGFMDAVKRFFGSEEADAYGSGTLLHIESAQSIAQLEDIIRRNGGRIESTDGSAMATDYTDVMEGGGTSAQDEQRLRLHEERLSVNKQPVQDGTVRVRKEVVTENQSVDVPVRREEVYVERVGAADSDGASTISGDEEISVPVMHEEVSVEKHPVTTEEIILGKRTIEEQQTVGASIRKERARLDTDGGVSPKGTVDDSRL